MDLMARPEQAGLEQGTSIGNYLVQRKLGSGAMGTIYLGENPEIRKRVAIKVLSRSLSEDRSMVDRFIQEARAIAMLEHPNIVETFDFGFLPDGRCYYTMEYLQGETLSERMKRGPLTLKEILGILMRVCDALNAVHANGIVHRDLKPSNIFLARKGDRTIVKLLDFGVAKVWNPEDRTGETITSTGIVLGTPAYMSPEQALGQTGNLSHLSDIFSLGVIAYRMLTNQLPVQGSSAAEVAVYYATQEPVPIRQANPTVTPLMARVVMQCLQKAPEQRFQSSALFYAAFRQACEDLPLDWTPEQKDPLLGQTLGNYRVERVLDAGAMGQVFLGIHPTIDRKVAIKVLHEELCARPEIAKRFMSEARAVNHINHPNIVEIFDFGILSDGRPYLIMEFLPGEDLGSYLDRSGALSLEEVLPMVRQIAAGLDAAHEIGVIHRDLKPENVFLIVSRFGRTIKLLDFGIAKILQPELQDMSATATGIVMGTPAYMSPEQALGHTDVIGPPCDVYALGVLIYRMLSGRLPYEAENYQQMMMKQVAEPPVPITARLPGFPPAIWRILERALQKDQTRRPPTAGDLFQELALEVSRLDPLVQKRPFVELSQEPLPLPPPPDTENTPFAEMSLPMGSISQSVGAGSLLGAQPRISRGALVAVVLTLVLAVGGIVYWSSGASTPDGAVMPISSPVLTGEELQAWLRAAEPREKPVRVKIISDPPGAFVEVTGPQVRLAGNTPVELDLPGLQDVHVRAMKPGFETRELQYRVPREFIDVPVILVLQPVKPPDPPEAEMAPPEAEMAPPDAEMAPPEAGMAPLEAGMAAAVSLPSVMKPTAAPAMKPETSVPPMSPTSSPGKLKFENPLPSPMGKLKFDDPLKSPGPKPTDMKPTTRFRVGDGVI